MTKNKNPAVNSHTQYGLLDQFSFQDSLQEVEADLNWRYLLAEIERIDLFIQRQVDLWQLAGQDPQDDLRGLYLTDQGINSLLQRPFASHWGHLINPDPLDQELLPLLEASNQRSQAILSQAVQQNLQLRLHHLVQAFQLDEFEVNTLLICLAPSLDLRYEKIFAYLQDDVTRKRPTVHLVLDLLCPAGQARFQSWKYFNQNARLFKYHLLSAAADTYNTPLLNQVLFVDNRIITWLLGHDQFQSNYLEFFSAQELAFQEEAPIAAIDANLDITSFINDNSPVLVLYGADHNRQDAIARRIAAERKQALLRLNLEAIAQEGGALLTALQQTLRDAILSNAVVYITGWDAALEANLAPSSSLLHIICTYPGQVVLSGRKHWVAKGFDRKRNLVWLETQLPAYPARLKLWRQFLQEKPIQEPVHWMALAGQFQLSTEQIRDACATAWDSASQRNAPLTNSDLFAAARAHSNPNLSNLARKIIPRYAWEDLIVPPDQLQILQELVATVLGRPLVLDDWGLGGKLASSRGVTVLFAGPPGTGKTMAAEVISGELGLDLYKIDLSTVISKYIGETEKNLEQIFLEAETSNAILFFDEADALFGKRSEVRDSHDRYANIEISYLLQRMEAYDGITILATNLRANLDEAFKRRLQFAVDFPFPEENDRLRIWQALFPQNAPHEADIDLALMARRFKLAGGNIRNILVNAAYLAAADGGRLGMAHLLHGAKRELQKMGRLVDEPGMFSIERLRST